MGENANTVTLRHLPAVIVATLLVVGAPAVVVWLLASSGTVTEFLPLVGIGLVVSLAVNVIGRAAWKAKPGGSDMLFSDLMIWGWIRRLRIERRLAGAVAILGIDDEEMRGRLDPGVQIGVLKQLATSLEARDPYLHGHSRRVARYAAMIAKEMELSGREVGKVRTAAAVHDVGKLEIPLKVLNKPGRLTEDEFDVIKTHAPRGAEMVADLGDRELTEMVAHHHERLDGSGYPSKLAGDDIPLGARIIAVADTFDALTSTRSYRSAKRHKEALSILHAEAGTQLDPRVVTAFDRCYQGSFGGLTVWALFAGLPHRLWAPLDSQLQAAAGGAAATKAVTVVVAATAVAGGVAANTGAADPRDTNKMPDGGVATKVASTTANTSSAGDANAWAEDAIGRYAHGRANEIHGEGVMPSGMTRPSRVAGDSAGGPSTSPGNGGVAAGSNSGSAFDPATPVTYPPSTGTSDGGAVADVLDPTPGDTEPGWEVSGPVTTGPVRPDHPGNSGHDGTGPGNSGHDGTGPGNSGHDGTGPGNSGHDGTAPGNSGHDGTGPGNSGHDGDLPGNSDHGGSGPGNSGHDDDHPGNSEGGGKPDSPGNSGHDGEAPGNSGHD